MVWSSACVPGSPAQVERVWTTSPSSVSDWSGSESSRTESSPTVPARPRARQPVARSLLTMKKATRGVPAPLAQAPQGLVELVPQAFDLFLPPSQPAAEVSRHVRVQALLQVS